MTMKSGKAGINLVSRIGLGGIKVFFLTYIKMWVDVEIDICAHTLCVYTCISSLCPLLEGLEVMTH